MSGLMKKNELPTSIDDFINKMEKLELDQRNLYSFRVRQMSSTLSRVYFRQKLDDEQQIMMLWDLKKTLAHKSLFQNDYQAIHFEYIIQELA